MPSSVDICNLALSHIGDVSDVQSISPPDGSVQAGFCSRFFPIAVNALLEQGSWGFSTTRQTLAQLEANRSSTWLYAYAMPAEAINVIAVIASDATDDYTESLGGLFTTTDFANPTLPYLANSADLSDANSYYTPQPFALETDGDGNQIVLTNVENAVLRYMAEVPDANQFTPLFVMALSYLLASMLAGPLIKGNTGMQVSAAMVQKAQAYTSQAKISDANQRRINLTQSVSWMAGR